MTSIIKIRHNPRLRLGFYSLIEHAKPLVSTNDPSFAHRSRMGPRFFNMAQRFKVGARSKDYLTTLTVDTWYILATSTAAACQTLDYRATWQAFYAAGVHCPRQPCHFQLGGDDIYVGHGRRRFHSEPPHIHTSLTGPNLAPVSSRCLACHHAAHKIHLNPIQVFH